MRRNASVLVVATHTLGVATAASLTFAIAIGLAIVSLSTAAGLKSIVQRVIGGAVREPHRNGKPVAV